MLRWIDAEFDPESTFNDWEDQRVTSRAAQMETGETWTIQGGIAGISPTEPLAIRAIPNVV